MKLSKQELTQIIAEYREAISKTKHKSEDIETFIQSASQTLFDYCAQFPEDTEFQYRIKRLFGRMELRISIPGEKKGLYESGEMSEERDLLRRIHAMKLASPLDTQYLYIRGNNTLIFLTPPVKRFTGLRNPLVLASLIGLVLGLLASLLPSSVTSVLVDDIASPVLDVALNLMTGIMGPIIFLSLVTAVSTAESIGELNRLGWKLFRQFLAIAVFITLVSMAVAFGVFSISKGQAKLDFTPDVLVNMLLSVIPTNLITPFTENNFPQLLVMGLAMGVALLLLDRKESALGNIILDLRDWINELLRLILILTPIIPGLTLFKIFAARDFSSFVRGWKFIAATYACMVIVLIVKLIKVKLHFRELNLSRFIHNIGPAVKTAFFSGSEIVAVKKFYEVTEGPLAISKPFASLWVPLNQSMLSPIGPIYYALAPFFVAKITGTPISLEALFILLILCVQLSLAYPGVTAGNTIIFHALGLSTDYVGMFSAYSIFIKNASAAYGIAYRALEITETAYATHNIDIEKCNQPPKAESSQG